MKHIYISGPMRSHDDYNFPAFFEAEEVIREVMADDVLVFNPAREDCAVYMLSESLRIDPTGRSAGLALRRNEPDFNLRGALASDLSWIAERCDLMVMLPGWEESKGAVAEHALAEALGIEVWHYGNFEPRHDEHLSGETRVTSATGGEKGQKLAAFDQISPEVEVLIAEHFGKGARKYSAHNFRKGYAWSLSYSALRRHLAAFWRGEEYDNHTPDCGPGCVDHTGSLHIVAVIWHAMVLTEFYLHHKEFDDRYVYRQA